MFYEFYYSILRDNFNSIYSLEVDRETEKMFYGIAKNKNSKYATRFSVRKNSIDTVEATHEYVYRIRTKGESFDEALQKTKALMYNFLLERAKVVNDAEKEVSK